MRLGAVAVSLAVGLGLSGCGGSSKNIFAPNNPPLDSSQVLYNPPLSVPPGYNAPPRLAPADTSGSASATESASTAALGAGQTPGEEAFLQAAGANDVDPNIRTLIDQSNSNQAAADPKFVDELLFGANTPAAAGSGAVIKRSSPGLLTGIF